MTNAVDFALMSSPYPLRLNEKEDDVARGSSPIRLLVRSH